MKGADPASAKQLVYSANCSFNRCAEQCHKNNTIQSTVNVIMRYTQNQYITEHRYAHYRYEKNTNQWKITNTVIAIDKIKAWTKSIFNYFTSTLLYSPKPTNTANRRQRSRKCPSMSEYAEMSLTWWLQKYDDNTPTILLSPELRWGDTSVWLMLCMVMVDSFCVTVGMTDILLGLLSVIRQSAARGRQTVSRIRNLTQRLFLAET